MKNLSLIFCSFMAFAGASNLSASQNTTQADGLIIHAAEMGIGKFHRYDDQVHSYAADNIWKNYVLPADADKTKTLLRVENADQSVTIFYSHLVQLMSEIEKVATEKNKQIAVLNINAHGMPGQMWFPKDEAAMNSPACASWVAAANGDDKANYDQYYSAVPKAAIMQYRLLAKLPSLKFLAGGCTTGASDWADVLKKHPHFKAVFTSDAQLHLFSCIVGLGRAGTTYVKKMSSLLFSGANAKVEASTYYGLGDWSMPEGMGFWDYQNEEQFEKDMKAYPMDRKDRDMMQKGDINLAFHNGKKWEIGLVKGVDFMLGTKDDLGFKDIQSFAGFADEQENAEAEDSSVSVQSLGVSGWVIQIPHTGTYVTVQ